MLENNGTFSSLPIIELASIFIAVIALIYAALALQAANAAVQATKESDMIGLRTKANESLASADQSLLTLQKACNDVNDAWQKHFDKQPMSIGSFSSNRHGLFGGRPDEVSRNCKLEQEGGRMLQELKNGFGNLDVQSLEKIEQLIAQAHTVSGRIERLSFSLESPPNPRF